MAPPRAPKKSAVTNPSTSTTRQSARRSRRQFLDEEEELEDLDQDDSAVGDEDAGHEEAEASQSTSDGPLEQMMAKMVDDRRKHDDKLKNRVGIAYNRKKEEIEESINAIFDTHEAEASRAHQAQLKRLQDLVSQKANIEAAMRKQLAGMQKIYNAHSRDLESVVDRRLRDMK